jgi:hypothetical protein
VRSLRIFISYSKDDGGDIADAIYQYYKKSGFTVFESAREIQGGEQWMQRILDDIAACDVFLAIVTRGALRSTYVEKEVLEAQRLGKRIIPCRHASISWEQIKWELDRIQGVQFINRPEPLLRDLDDYIEKILSITPVTPPQPASVNLPGGDIKGVDLNVSLKPAWNNILTHLYRPGRFTVLDPVKTITGVVGFQRAQTDGSIYFLLGDGDKTISCWVICAHGSITRPAAIPPCTEYHNDITIPPLGIKVEVIGQHVSSHQKVWTYLSERIHPVFEIKVLD